MRLIMLIDDDGDTLTCFGTILSRAGYQVVVATSGRRALDLVDSHYREQRPLDLILSDLRLPDISGLDILRHIRHRRLAVPFVVLTGFGRTQDAVEAMRLGATDFLEKPIFEDALLRTVA